jgi:hypothetical protein
MNRRGFLRGILAAGVAPAFIGSSILMPVRKIITQPQSLTITPEWFAFFGNIAYAGDYDYSYRLPPLPLTHVFIESTYA